MTIAIAVLFLVLVCGLAASSHLPVAVPVLYLAASATAFVLYRADKSAALAGGWRTPEDTLLVLGLLGGWPGALVAQRVFRHKSRKVSFQLLFWLTVVVNCGLVVWFWLLNR